MSSPKAGPVPLRTLGTVDGGLRVPALGLGCMGMSEFYGPRDDAQSMDTLRRALDLGVTLLDSADTYGHGHNESLIGRLVQERGRDAVTVATKFGIQREEGAYARGINNAPDYVRSACEASLKRLGIDTIDLYYIHRIDTTRDIEEPMNALAGLVRDGKVRHVGICEASPATLRRAHAVHPLTAVQTEYSLWTRDVEDENGVLATCRELGIGFVPYSPLGRGFLTGTMTSTDGLADDDFRRANPRFQDENLAANLTLVQALESIAREKRCTVAQLALAWVLAQGDDVVPIPGTRQIRYLEQNVDSVSISLEPADLQRLEQVLPSDAVRGERYTIEGMKGVNA